MVYFARFRYGISPCLCPDRTKERQHLQHREEVYISIQFMPFGLCNALPFYEGSGMRQRNRESKNNDCGTNNSFS